MPLNYNEYFPIVKAGSEAVRLSETLLQSYPLTRACLGILGRKLLNKLEYGFFAGGTDIIVQGDQGKDLFLLCQNVVDVLVDGHTVVQMEAPSLFGDKGIVEPKSTRAASIRVAEEQTCFFIKIPLGIFVRNFDDMKIPDEDFNQEIGIFYNMFKEIQNRLFDYSFIQKNLWEEVSTTLSLLNLKQVIESLDKKIDRGWDEKVWNAAKQHLLEELNFAWPEEVPLDVGNFRRILFEYLDKKFPREAFKKTDAEYVQRKLLLWKKWLTSVASLIVKMLPDDMLSVNIGEVELFNPRNYHLRIQALIRAIEKRFLVHKVKDSSAADPKNKAISDTGIKSFFGKTDRSHVFDLKRYLASFEQQFELRYPKRMQVQIAQRTALVAAKCENEFNESVARMQEFLDKYHPSTGEASKGKGRTKADTIAIGRELGLIGIAYSAYNRKLKETVQQRVGQVSYQPGLTPTMSDLVKSSASKEVRAELRIAFKKVVSALNIPFRLLPMDFIQKHMFVCEASPGFEVPARELEQHYWIPISSGIFLDKGGKNYGIVQQGSIIGGKGWIQVKPQEEGPSDAWSLKIPERKSDDPMGLTYLLFVLPFQEIPWEQDLEPHPDQFGKHHLPVMQWLINKHIDEIENLLEKRDAVFENWTKTERVVRLENKVKAFENTRVTITPKQQLKIADLLKNVVGLNVEKVEELSSDQLSKSIYNHILKQMMIDYSNIPIQDLGNKTYTKWRFILSDIIRSMEQSEIDKTVNMASPFFEMIETELATMLESFSLQKSRRFIHLSHQAPYIQLANIIGKLENPDQDRLLLFQLIQSILETYLRLLYEEIRDYEQRYQEISANRTQSDMQSMQIETILEAVAKLQTVIGETFAE
ncbi:MAG: hypothetical protein GY866_21770 [Proteobacteria bacterium]|nr:hypothetical protein [Pseudomonadota bacterium]